MNLWIEFWPLGVDIFIMHRFTTQHGDAYKMVNTFASINMIPPSVIALSVTIS